MSVNLVIIPVLIPGKGTVNGSREPSEVLMLAWLKRWFHRPPSAPPEEGSGAAHAGDEPEDLHRGRHRLKERYTSHWDLDYLSQEELDELLGDDSDEERSNRR